MVACGNPTVSEIRAMLRKDVPVVFRDPRAAFRGAGSFGRGYSVSFGRAYNGGNSIDLGLSAIIRKGPDAAELLPEVLELLGDADESAISLWRVLPVLSAMKTAARPAVPRLLRLFEETQKESELNRQGWSIKIAEAMFDAGMDVDELVGILT